MNTSSENTTITEIQNCIDTIHSVEANAWIYGTIVAFGIYCATLIVGIGQLRIVITQLARKKPLDIRQWFLSVYVAVAFLLSSLAIAGSIQRTSELLSAKCDVRFILQFGHDDSQASLTETGGLMVTVSFVLTSWAADGIMIWRFLAICHDLKVVKWPIFMLSLLLQMGSMVLGAFVLLGLGGSDTGDDIDFTNIYLIIIEAIALSQNIVLTTLIVGRLLLFRYRTQKALGGNHGNEYISVTTMLVESQSLLGVGQAALVGTGIRGKYGNIMYQVVGQLQVLAPIVLIYRVLQGKTYVS
ncbi:hypothetical protein BDQ17DRAFT_1376324 [Cyathus striatus]|nr:hypothetical protein BDQ17DRAFT_1376324 [Cyathus striatus]